MSTQPKKPGDETIETIDDITRKNAISKPLTNDATPTVRSETMLKPSFRLFIVPLGAVATLATLSAQNIQPRAQREARPDALGSHLATVARAAPGACMRIMHGPR